MMMMTPLLAAVVVAIGASVEEALVMKSVKMGTGREQWLEVVEA